MNMPSAGTQSSATVRRLTALVILLAAVVVYCCWRPSSSRQSPEPQENTSPVPPWGRLEKVRITIERPRAIISASSDRYPTQREWLFGGLTAVEVEALLRSAGAAEFTTNLPAWREDSQGTHVPVDPGLILGMSSQARQALYPRLARWTENAAQFQYYAFPNDEADDWFLHTGLSPRSVGAVTNRYYRLGGLTCFADLAEVLTQIDSEEERTRLVKAVSREITLLIKLHVDERTDVGALLDFWGRFGRAKSLEPLLESLKRVPGGARIDIVHLLPPFARQRLYTYPEDLPGAKGAVQDCFWTSFNFFNDPPEFCYGDTAEVATAIDQHYRRVKGNPQMGDLLLLVNEQGKAIHAAIFIAEDVVFTKNGEAYTHPWLLMELKDLLNIYTGDRIPRVVTYRRNEIE